jgi:Icc-related predicted phosphoesterase
MKICAISDMHGKLDFTIKPCDILCICGDIVPTYIQVYRRETLDWLARDFVPWCDKQPCEKVFLIAGNHDWTAMRSPDDWEEMFKGTKITYLLDSLAEYKGLKIYGTPWCHKFFNWAFMTSDEDLKKIYSKMPEGVDILLTHDCSYCNNDILLQEDFYT